MNSDDTLATVSIFIALLSLVGTIRSLKLTEHASKTADSSLLMSMYLQKRRDLSDSLVYFYYPINKYLSSVHFTNGHFSSDTTFLNIALDHEYLGNEKILNDVLVFCTRHDSHLVWGMSDFQAQFTEYTTDETKSNIKIMKSHVGSIIDQKNKDIEELTKKIEALGGKNLL